MKNLHFFIVILVLVGCENSQEKKIQFLGIKIGDTQQTVLATLSNPTEKYLSSDRTYESWSYTYQPKEFNKISVERTVEFEKLADTFQVTGINCVWESPEVDEQGYMEGFWSVQKPCDLNGIGIYSGIDDVKKKFGEPQNQILIPDILDKKTIYSLIYKEAIIHAYKTKVIGIYLGKNAVHDASVHYVYPIHLLKNN